MSVVQYSGMGRVGIDDDFLFNDSINWNMMTNYPDIFRDYPLGSRPLLDHELDRLRRLLIPVVEELFLSLGVPMEPHQRRIEEEQGTVHNEANQIGLQEYQGIHSGITSGTGAFGLGLLGGHL